MGDTHFRSNIIEQGDDSLKIKFTNASFTNLTVTNLAGDSVQRIATLTSNSFVATTAHIDNVTATSMVVKNATITTAYFSTKATVAATPGFVANVVASFTSLTGGTAARMLRVTTVGATPMYVKLYTR